jgi:outer membrane protein TolC
VRVRQIVPGLSLSIDLPTSLALAGARNLDVREAKARLAEQKARSEQALGALMPSAYGSMLTFGQKTSGSTLGFFTDLGRSFDRVNGAGGVDLSVNPAQAMFEALAAHRTVNAATSDSLNVTQATLAKAAIGYFALEQAQATVKIAEQALDSSRELERVTRDRQSLGSGLKVDVLRAHARVASDALRLSQAGEAMRNASIQLALTLKLDPKVTLLPSETSVWRRTLIEPSVSLDDLIRRALASRPTLEAQSERVMASEQHRNAAWSSALAPSAFANYQQNTVENLGSSNFYVRSDCGFPSLRLAPRAPPVWKSKVSGFNTSG